MKKVYSLTMLLIVTCLLLSSCSHLAIKPQNLAKLNVGLKTENNKFAVEMNIDDYQSKGINPILKTDAMMKETKAVEDLIASAGPVAIDDNISIIIKDHRKSLASLNNSDVSSFQSNLINKYAFYSNTQTTYHPVNYYNGGGRSGGGVPLWFLIVLCIFIPPLAVAIMYGLGDKFWISLILTLLFWIPGVIYALIQVLR